MYGLALIQELRRHGYEIGAGTLYPILHALEKSGYLVRENRVVAGRVRKYYSATVEGRHALAQTRPFIRELMDEALAGRGPRHPPDPLDEHGS